MGCNSGGIQGPAFCLLLCDKYIENWITNELISLWRRLLFKIRESFTEPNKLLISLHNQYLFTKFWFQNNSRSPCSSIRCTLAVLFADFVTIRHSIAKLRDKYMLELHCPLFRTYSDGTGIVLKWIFCDAIVKAQILHRRIFFPFFDVFILLLIRVECNSLFSHCLSDTIDWNTIVL